MLGHGALGEFALGEFGVAEAPAVGFPAGRRHRRYVDLSKQERAFSRKVFEEMLAAEAAIEAAEIAAAQEAKTSKERRRKAALQAAADAAIKALDEAAEHEAEVADLQRITAALEAAVGAVTVNRAVSQAKAAMRAADLLREHLEDEEEVMLLLLH